MRLLAWVALLLLLSGCASSSPTLNRYTLPAGDGEAKGAGADASHRLQLRSLRVAHFLNVDGIVLQLDDITLNEARHHLWAEPLPRQLERRLLTRLATALPDTRIMRGSGDAEGARAMRLHLEVERFQGRYDGVAVVAGEWQLRDSDGELVAVEPFEVETELDDDGYPALVRALGRGWSRVGAEIGAAIRELR